MPIYEHLTEFMGNPVVDWNPDKGLRRAAGKAVRVSCDYDDEEGWAEKFDALLESSEAGGLAGLVIGPWSGEMSGTEPDEVIEAVADAPEGLPNLKAIFFGDVIVEECEISWIKQADVSPLLNAFPALEHFGVRGGEGLSFGRLRHAALRTLIVQTGGLPASVIKEIAAADLPNLERLELWLGDEEYGADTSVADLEPFLKGDRFPRLKYLGLKDCHYADDVAAAVAKAPVLDRLDVLDLSMGTLGDEGAKALIASPAVRKLKKLDIHHHYCSDEVVKELEGLGIEVDASEPEGEADADDRYVEVGE